MDTGGSIEELSKLGREELLRRARASAPQVSFVDNAFSRLLQELLSCWNPFNRVIFEKRLDGAVAVIPFEEALHRILFPLQEQVGQLRARWSSGRGHRTLRYEANPIKDFLGDESVFSG